MRQEQQGGSCLLDDVFGIFGFVEGGIIDDDNHIVIQVWQEFVLQVPEIIWER